MKQVIKFDIVETQAIDKLLNTLPNYDGKGMLPFTSLEATPEWQMLAKNHTPQAIRSKMSKMWRGRVVPVEPKPVAALGAIIRNGPAPVVGLLNRISSLEKRVEDLEQLFLS